MGIENSCRQTSKGKHRSEILKTPPSAPRQYPCYFFAQCEWFLRVWRVNLEMYTKSEPVVHRSYRMKCFVFVYRSYLRNHQTFELLYAEQKKNSRINSQAVLIRSLW